MKIIRRIIIVVFILILIIVSIIFKVNKNIEIQKNIEIEETPIIDNDIKLLENRNIFFTISTCIDKYTTYIANKDTKSLIDILDKGYINSHNITENSILDSLDKFDMTQINVVRKVFEREIDGYNSTYYVYYTSRDNLEAEMEDGFQGEVERAKEKDKYIIVNLNFKNETFSIMPYDGKLFINN